MMCVFVQMKQIFDEAREGYADFNALLGRTVRTLDLCQEENQKFEVFIVTLIWINIAEELRNLVNTRTKH